MKKRVLTIIVSSMLVASMLITGCGGTNQGASGTDKDAAKKSPSQENNSIVFALNAEPTTLDPQLAAERITWIPVTQIFDRLVYEDENGVLQPSLAESWETSADGTSITFKIRQDVKFHNGDIMTTEDVAFSINRAINDYPSKLYSSSMLNMEVIDATSVKLNLKYSFSPALYCINHCSFGIVNKKAVEADKEGYGRKPIGTGPFKFVEWVSGDHVTVDRYEEYWKSPASLSKITFKTITDTSSSVLALEKGEIDVVQTVPESYRNHLEQSDKVNYYSTAGASIYALTFNNEKGTFVDENLRLAVSHAINREELIAGAIEGNGVPLYAPMASFAFGYPDMNTFKPAEYSLEKSKEYLAKAGKPDGFKIVLKCTEAANYTKPAEIIQAQLAKVGIQVEIQQMERGTYLQEVYKNCDYEMSIWSMTSDYPDGDSPTYARLHGSMKGNTNNYVLVDIPELNDALDIGRKSTVEAERKAAYLKVSEIVRDKAPLVPLYSQNNNIAANANLQGVRAHYGLVVNAYDYSWGEPEATPATK